MTTKVLGWPSDIQFTKNSVFVTFVGPTNKSPVSGTYSFGRDGGAVTKVSPADFDKLIPEKKRLPPIQVLNDSTGYTRLTTSDGTEYHELVPNCSEKQDHDQLTLGSQHVDLVIPSCDRANSVETLNDYLLIGTMGSGEGPRSPADGILVVSKDGKKLVRKIGADDGLPDQLVLGIRRDPYQPIVWVLTRTGIASVAYNLQVVRRLYFYYTLDAKTHAAELALSPIPRRSDAFAVMSTYLELGPSQDFYNSVLSILVGIRSKFDPEILVQGGSSGRRIANDPGILPKQLNILLPYFEKSMLNKSSDDEALQVAAFAAGNICRFDSPDVKIFLEDFKAAHPNYMYLNWIDNCLYYWPQRGK